jgi:hypothetical protein
VDPDGRAFVAQKLLHAGPAQWAYWAHSVDSPACTLADFWALSLRNSQERSRGIHTVLSLGVTIADPDASVCKETGQADPFRGRVSFLMLRPLRQLLQRIPANASVSASRHSFHLVAHATCTGSRLGQCGRDALATKEEPYPLGVDNSQHWTPASIAVLDGNRTVRQAVVFSVRDEKLLYGQGV